MSGLGKSSGNAYQVGNLNSPGTEDLQKNTMALSGGRTAENALKYGQGNMSLQDAVYGTSNVAGNEFALALNPMSGSKLATDQVQNNSILGQLYGQNGQLSSAIGDANKMQNQGYTLKPSDYDAMGQASGNIARQTGTQEQALAQALASRGLSQGNSGAAQQQFTNLYGNKFEQLGQMQQQIAQQRVQNNLAQLNATRDYITNLGGQAGNEIQNQYARNASGIGQIFGQQNAVRAQDFNEYQGIEGNKLSAAKDQRAAASPGIMGAVNSGILSGVNSGVQSGMSAGTNAIGGAIGSAFKSTPAPKAGG